MKVRTMLTGFALLGSVLSTGCNRNKQEAIILANKGDISVDSNPGDAIQKYEEAVKLDENHQILYKLAKAYRKKEDWEKVQSTLQRATSKAPTFANYWFELGLAVEMQAKKPEKGGAKWSDAVEPYTKCVEADPNDERCLAHLAEAYYFSDDEQKALQRLSEAVEKRPADGDMTKKCVDDPAVECSLNHYTSLAHRYILLDYLKEAEQVLNAAVEMADPKDKRLYNVYTLLAEVYGEQHDTDKMVKALEKAREVREDEPGLLFNLGMAYAQVNPPKKAEALARLKGFTARACTKDAAKYRKECDQANTVVQKLSGPGN
jgi:tetratricopeptide (TPR) repeat protein